MEFGVGGKAQVVWASAQGRSPFDTANSTSLLALREEIPISEQEVNGARSVPLLNESSKCVAIAGNALLPPTSIGR